MYFRHEDYFEDQDYEMNAQYDYIHELRMEHEMYNDVDEDLYYEYEESGLCSVMTFEEYKKMVFENMKEAENSDVWL